MSEKTPRPLSVIERLRAGNPNRNICDVAVEQLDNPTEMSAFLIQYAQELGRTSERPETKAHPFDTAVKLVDRMAGLHGGKVASRWHELIDTGTVRSVPDHEFDWLTPHRRLQAKAEAELGTVRAQNARLDPATADGERRLADKRAVLGQGETKPR